MKYVCLTDIAPPRSVQTVMRAFPVEDQYGDSLQYPLKLLTHSNA